METDASRASPPRPSAQRGTQQTLTERSKRRVSAEGLCRDASTGQLEVCYICTAVLLHGRGALSQRRDGVTRLMITSVIY